MQLKAHCVELFLLVAAEAKGHVRNGNIKEDMKNAGRRSICVWGLIAYEKCRTAVKLTSLESTTNL